MASTNKEIADMQRQLKDLEIRKYEKELILLRGCEPDMACKFRKDIEEIEYEMELLTKAILYTINTLNNG